MVCTKKVSLSYSSFNTKMILGFYCETGLERYFFLLKL